MKRYICDYCGKEVEKSEGEKNKLLLWCGNGRLKLYMHQSCTEIVKNLLERVAVHTMRGDRIMITVEAAGKNFRECCEEMLLSEVLTKESLRGS